MREREIDLVVGIHSIVEAVLNKSRRNLKLFTTEETLFEIKKRCKLDNVQVTLLASHKVQEESKQFYKELELEYQRVPSNAFLVCSALEIGSVDRLYEMARSNKGLRILCLDQISDVHNAGAIVRTACFYNVDVVVVPDQRSFGLTPSFFRIASGAAEYVELVNCSKLSRVISKLQDLGVMCIAMSEHAEQEFNSEALGGADTNVCIVVGKEDTGISNAVLRQCAHKMSITSQGEIKSLNVSIATSVVLEKCFGKMKKNLA